MKAQLKFYRGEWWCIGAYGLARGSGTTPKEAYDNMMKHYREEKKKHEVATIMLRRKWWSWQ